MKVTRNGCNLKVDVTADGAGLVSHAGSGLLAGVADRVGLTAALSEGLVELRERRAGHDPGRVIRDLAVMLADGGDCLSDLRAVRDQSALFGAVASDSTAFRVIDKIASTPGLLDALDGAHARAREQVWKLTGAPGRVTIDLDATLLTSRRRRGSRSWRPAPPRARRRFPAPRSPAEPCRARPRCDPTGFATPPARAARGSAAADRGALAPVLRARPSRGRGATRSEARSRAPRGARARRSHPAWWRRRPRGRSPACIRR